MTLRQELEGPDGDLLSLMRLQGGGFPGRERDPRLLDLQIRLQHAGALEEALERSRAEGWRAMVALGESKIFTVLQRARPELLPLPLPVVPNLQGFMREAVEYGMVGAGMRRVLRVGPLGLTGLAFRSVGRLGALWRREFPTMLRSFVELELAEVARYQPRVVFLQAQMTDLALAMNNPRIFCAFTEAVQRRTGAAVGFISFNIVALERALRAWGVEPQAVLTAWEADGAAARPDATAARAAIAALDVPVWGLRRDWLAPPASEERTAARAAGLAGWAREDAAAWSDDDAQGAAA